MVTNKGGFYNENYNALINKYEQTNTSVKRIEMLIKYYITSLHWTVDEAINYCLKLFDDRTIDSIKILGMDEKDL